MSQNKADLDHKTEYDKEIAEELVLKSSSLGTEIFSYGECANVTWTSATTRSLSMETVDALRAVK